MSARWVGVLVGVAVGFVGAVAGLAGWTLHQYNRHVLKRRGWHR